MKAVENHSGFHLRAGKIDATVSSCTVNVGVLPLKGGRQICDLCEHVGALILSSLYG